mgnify:CR=1 FL=1
MQTIIKKMEDPVNIKKSLRFVFACFLFFVIWRGSNLAAYAGMLSDNATQTAEAAKDDVTKDDAGKDETEGLEPVEPEVKVLMIGNSFTKRNNGDVGMILQELAKANHKNLKVRVVANNGAYLSYYAFWTEAYKTYFDRMMSAFKRETYDYIIFQDYTKAGIEQYENEMLPSARQLMTYIRAYQPKAQVLLYETAGYSNGTSTNVDGTKRMLSIEEFQERTLYAYTRLQNHLGVKMLPAGMKVFHSSCVHPAINMIDTDLKHPSYAGYYFVAACFYHEIYGEKPTVKSTDLSGCNLYDVQLSMLNSLIRDKITISKSELQLSIGKGAQLWAAVDAPTAGGVLYWKSLNPEIATVNSNTGYVTGVGEGATAVIAKTTTGLMAVCNVTIENTVIPQLSFGKNFYQVNLGDRIRLTPRVRNGKEGDSYKWTSSNTKVAKVSADGTVTACKMGKAVIKVRYNSSSSASASYTLYVSGQKPEKLTAKITRVSSNGGKIRLSWNKVAEATQYRIYRFNSNTRQYEYIGASKGTAYTDSTAKINKKYYYKVSAVSGHILTETELSEKVDMTIPGTVKIKVTATSKKYVKITWKKNSKANGYTVYRASSKGGKYKKIATIGTNKRVYYYDRSVKKGKTYYYRVKTYRKEAKKVYYSAYSNTIKGKAETKK